MPRKKKPFLRKKDADTYAVVSRSRADPTVGMAGFQKGPIEDLVDPQTGLSIGAGAAGENVLVPIHLGASAATAAVLPDEVFAGENAAMTREESLGMSGAGADGGPKIFNPFLTQPLGMGGAAGGENANTATGRELTDEQQRELDEVRAQLEVGDVEQVEEVEEDGADGAAAGGEEQLMMDDDSVQVKSGGSEEAQLRDLAQRQAGILPAIDPATNDPSVALADDFVSLAQGGAPLPVNYRDEDDPNFLAEQKLAARGAASSLYEDGGEGLDLDGLEGDDDDDYAGAGAAGRRRVHFAAEDAPGLERLDDLEDDLPDWAEVGAGVGVPKDPLSLRGIMDARFERLVGREYDDGHVGGLEDDEEADGIFAADEGDDLEAALDARDEVEGVGAPALSQFADVFDEFLEQHQSVEERKRRAIAEQARRDRERDEEEYDELSSGDEGPPADWAHGGGVRRRGMHDKTTRYSARSDDLDAEQRQRLKDAALRLEESRQRRASREPEKMVEIAAPRKVEQWDAQSIVSTYSNLDNHPHIVQAPISRKQQKARAQRKRRRDADEDDMEGGAAGEGFGAAADGPVPQIRLSKHGVPIGVMGDGNKAPLKRARSSEEQPGEMGVDGDAAMGAAVVADVDLRRTRDETKEEKRARKQAQKELTRAARQRKAGTKQAFKGELAKQRRQRVNQPQQSVLKI